MYVKDETEGSTGFRAPRKLYRHPRAKCKGVIGFQGNLNPRVSLFMVFILYSWQPIKLLSVLAPKLLASCFSYLKLK